MLRIPVSMHNVPDEEIISSEYMGCISGTRDLESADYRACEAYGPLYK